MQYKDIKAIYMCRKIIFVPTKYIMYHQIKYRDLKESHICRHIMFVPTRYIIYHLTQYKDLKASHMCRHIMFVPTKYTIYHQIQYKYIKASHMGWLRSVGSIELQVSFTEYSLFYRSLLQKRPTILSLQLNQATPSEYYGSHEFPG